MDVSIIIVNYNTKALLQNCLNSVFEKTKDIVFVVIIVDNASTDDSKLMLREKFFAVKLIENLENLGFGRANNLGAQSATGKYIFFLNSDTILQNNAVKILFDFMETHLDTGISGGNLFDKNGNPAHSFAKLPNILKELKNKLSISEQQPSIRIDSTQFNFTNIPQKVGYITGADLMIKNDLFSRLNGFDPDFFLYSEETELTYRVKKLGYDVYNVPFSEIIHLGGISAYSIEKKCLIAKSQVMYFRKTQNGFAAFLLHTMILLRSISALMIYSVLGNKQKIEYWDKTIKNYKKKQL